MVAADDPLVGQLAALQRRDDAVGRGELPVELQLQVDAGRAGTDVVGERQRAAPCRRRRRAAERLEQRLRVGVGDRQHRDLHQRRRFLERRALGVLGRADAGRQRIAGIHRQVHHRAALGGAVAAPAAVRVDVALEVAVLARIRVDQAADRAVLGGDLRLDAAPRSAIAGDDDLALHVDAAALELLVVGRHAVVDVDELGGHVAVRGVDVERRQRLGRLVRRGVFLQRRLGQRRHELRRGHELDLPQDRRREQHLVVGDGDLVAPGTEQAGDELGVVLAVRRAEVVRAGGEPAHPGAQVLGLELAVEALLEVEVRGASSRREAGQRRALLERGRAGGLLG